MAKSSDHKEPTASPTRSRCNLPRCDLQPGGVSVVSCEICPPLCFLEAESGKGGAGMSGWSGCWRQDRPSTHPGIVVQTTCLPWVGSVGMVSYFGGCYFQGSSYKMFPLAKSVCLECLELHLRSKC